MTSLSLLLKRVTNPFLSHDDTPTCLRGGGAHTLPSSPRRAFRLIQAAVIHGCPYPCASLAWAGPRVGLTVSRTHCLPPSPSNASPCATMHAAATGCLPQCVTCCERCEGDAEEFSTWHRLPASVKPMSPPVNVGRRKNMHRRMTMLLLAVHVTLQQK